MINCLLIGFKAYSKNETHTGHPKFNQEPMSRELIGPGVKLQLSSFSQDILLIYPPYTRLCTHEYIHGLVQLSLVREAFCAKKQLLMQKTNPLLVKALSVSTKCSVIMGHLCHTLHVRLRHHQERRDRKVVRARNLERPEQTVSSRHDRTVVHINTAAGLACMRSRKSSTC